jgi:hypothetical protein
MNVKRYPTDFPKISEKGNAKSNSTPENRVCIHPSAKGIGHKIPAE